MKIQYMRRFKLYFLLTLTFLLWPNQAARAAPCGLGFQSGSTISAADIDGNRGPEWADAALISSSDPCLDQLIDVGGIPKNVNIYSKRYTRGTDAYLALFFEVEDNSDSAGGGLLVNGERIVLQFDPNSSRGSGLENGASASAKDYRIDISHKWQSSSTDPGLVANVGVQVYNSSLADPACGNQQWQSISGPSPTVVIRKDFPGGYKVEVELPLSLIGNPGSDIGVAIAVINDHGTTTFDAYGAAFPSGLPVSNTDNPVTGCHPSWVVPNNWGIGYFTTTPSGDVTISRNPVFYQSEAIDAFACDTLNYTYYPAGPCRLRLEATVDNSSSSDQDRNLLFLWADHGASPSTWRVISLVEGVTVPAMSSDTFSSAEWDPPIGLPNHPCVRVYILPPVYEAAFDRNDILAISNSSDLAQMVMVYGLGDQHWAQKNISRYPGSDTCPVEGCGIGSIFDGSGLLSQVTGFISRQIALPLAARPLLPAGLGILLIAGLALLLVRGRGATQLRTKQRRFSRWGLVLVGFSLMAGLLLSCEAPKRAPTATPTSKPRPPTITPPTVTPAPEARAPIFLTEKELELFGRDNAIVQVQSFGYSEPVPDQKLTYNFIEDLGGVIQLFPVDLLLEQGKLPFQMNVTNPGEVQRTIFLRVNTLIPRNAEFKELKVELNIEREIFKPGETRVIEGTVAINQ